MKIFSYRGKDINNRYVYGLLLREEIATCFKGDPKDTKYFIVASRIIDWGFPYEYLKIPVDKNTVACYTNINIKDSDGNVHSVYENDILMYDGDFGVVKFDEELNRFVVYFEKTDCKISLTILNSKSLIFYKEG